MAKLPNFTSCLNYNISYLIDISSLCVGMHGHQKGALGLPVAGINVYWEP